MNRAAGNQHLQFTAEILTTESPPIPPTPPYKGGKGSNRDKRQITVPRHENDLVSGGGPAVWRF